MFQTVFPIVLRPPLPQSKKPRSSWRHVSIASLAPDDGKCYCPGHGMEHGKVEMGPVILLRISREFGKSLEWLLTGER
jgi:hypothetical protein